MAYHAHLTLALDLLNNLNGIVSSPLVTDRGQGRLEDFSLVFLIACITL